MTSFTTLILLGLGCSTNLDKFPDGMANNTDSEPWECLPGGEYIDIHQGGAEGVSAVEYAAMCEPFLGVTPETRCEDGVHIPILKDGVEVWEWLDDYSCDNYSLQSGQCVPGSTINRIQGQTRTGEPLPEVEWLVFCRTFPPTGLDMLGGSLQMLGYNRETGASCFFGGGALDNFHDGTDPDPELWIAKSDVPSSMNSNRFNQVFQPPGDFQCSVCHKATPFVHDSWIDQAKMPNDPNETVLPTVSDPTAPYWVVGHNHWDMRTIHIEDNACLECHRISMYLMESFENNGWDPNNHMPPEDPGSMSEDYQELLDCWTNGPENTPGCDWIIPPGGECEGGIVGDDYPHGKEFDVLNLEEQVE